MLRSLRHLLVWLHVLFSVGWMSQAAAMCVLMLMSAPAPPGGYKVMTIEAARTIDASVLVACANASAFTGFALAAVTTWGYFRYWWVATKFAITVGQLYLGIFILSPTLHEAAVAAGNGADGPVVPLAAGTAFMASALAFQAWLSVAKPWGRTRRGEREAAAPTLAPAPVFALCLVAPMIDLALLVALGDPTPVAQLPALVVVLVERRRRNRRAAPSGGVPARPARYPARVAAISEVCAGVKRLVLVPDEPRPWRPGAHIDVALPSGLVRQYSLVGGDGGGYAIAVKLEAGGRGGSREIHGLNVGDRVAVSGPRNGFGLVEAPSYLFLAGGIGVTPFLPMLAELDAAGRDFRLVLRGRGEIPFAGELVARYGDRVTVSGDGEERPDIARIVAERRPGAAVYVCGPESMIAAAEAAGPVRSERFAAAGLDPTGAPFDLYLARSRRTVHVGGAESTLDALRQVLPDAPSSCGTGLCGSCRTAVVAGVADHRDAVPDGGRDGAFYPCVSRSAGPLLVVDA